MKTAEEFYNEIKGNYTIIELMEMYALEVAKETQRRCAENAILIESVPHSAVYDTIDKQSILNSKNIPEI